MSSKLILKTFIYGLPKIQNVPSSFWLIMTVNEVEGMPVALLTPGI